MKTLEKYGKLLKRIKKRYTIEVYVVPKTAVKKNIYPLVVIVFKYGEKYTEPFIKRNVKRSELSKLISELTK